MILKLSALWLIAGFLALVIVAVARTFYEMGKRDGIALCLGSEEEQRALENRQRDPGVLVKE